MEEQDLKQLVNKHKLGDYITKEELKTLLKMYTELEKNLKYLGERHHFSWLDCFNEKQRLEDMLKFRKNRE